MHFLNKFTIKLESILEGIQILQPSYLRYTPWKTNSGLSYVDNKNPSYLNIKFIRSTKTFYEDVLVKDSKDPSVPIDKSSNVEGTSTFYKATVPSASLSDLAQIRIRHHQSKNNSVKRVWKWIFKIWPRVFMACLKCMSKRWKNSWVIVFQLHHWSSLKCLWSLYRG